MTRNNCLRAHGIDRNRPQSHRSRSVRTLSLKRCTAAARKTRRPIGRCMGSLTSRPRGGRHRTSRRTRTAGSVPLVARCRSKASAAAGALVGHRRAGDAGPSARAVTVEKSEGASRQDGDRGGGFTDTPAGTMVSGCVMVQGRCGDRSDPVIAGRRHRRTRRRAYADRFDHGATGDGVARALSPHMARNLEPGRPNHENTVHRLWFLVCSRLSPLPRAPVAICLRVQRLDEQQRREQQRVLRRLDELRQRQRRRERRRQRRLERRLERGNERWKQWGWQRRWLVQQRRELRELRRRDELRRRRRQ